MRYHSLHDNSYIRTFYGHKDRITNIDLNKTNDTFMTCGLDKTILLWDIRQSIPIAKLQVDGRPTIAQDYEGLVFAIGTGINEIKLYDSRKYEPGPFLTKAGYPLNSDIHNNLMTRNVKQKQEFEWCKMEFSQNGKYLLVSTRTNLLLLIDAFDGELITKYTTYSNNKNLELYPSFTGNGRYISVGDCKGDIYHYEVIKHDSNNNNHSSNIKPKILKWNGHPNSVQHFKWNPKYAVGISAAKSLVFWLPNKSSKVYKSNLKRKNKDKKRK